MKRLTTVLVFIGMLWFILHVGYLLYDGLTDELAMVDVAVVLGNTVNPNGRPSRRLQGRLDEALDLYKKGFFKKIIVSGGLAKEGFCEAEVMGDYLEKHGIPNNLIVRDKAAGNTFETAVNTKIMMAENQWKTVMVITQAYHITRTKLAFRRVGISHVYAAHARYFELRDVYSTIREFIGFYKYLFLRA